MNFQHVQSGAPLVISATEYNAMLDAGQAARNRPVNHGPHGKGFDSLFVYIANATGRRLQKFAVVGLDEALHNTDCDEFSNRLAFKGVVPSKEKHAGRFGILQADCEPRQLVRACVSGITIARIRAKEESNGKEIYACDVTDGETQFLSQGGHQEVLWSDSTNNDRWALIRIGRLQRFFKGKLKEDIKAKAEKVTLIAEEDEREVEVTLPYPDQTPAYPKDHPCRYYAGLKEWILLDFAPHGTILKGKLASGCSEGGSTVSITPEDGGETITADVPYPDDLQDCSAGHPCRYYADGDGWTLLDLACPKDDED
jgi:hypothetical protein